MHTRFITFIYIVVLFLPSRQVLAQSKADKKMAKQVEADITYLASDDLEGRRTGMEGERKAADYIEKRYAEEKISAYKNQYRYPFHFVYGKEIAASTQIHIGGNSMRMNDDAFPMPFSATKHVNSEVLPDVMEQGNIWMIPLYTDQDQADAPHFEAEKFMFEKAREASKQGASGIVFFGNFGGKWEPEFNKHSEYDPLTIPVVYVTHQAYQNFIKSKESKGGISIDLDITINKSERTGHNIAAYIDNGAPYTAIIGAHYDHLGYGEDGNSLFANAVKEHQIHHGADDNASGTAALLEVAKWIKNKKLSNFNYLFINFSGEELGLYGSKAFVKDQGIDSSKVAYMINMDMVGRLNDSTHSLQVGGVGTSPSWAEVADLAGDGFKLTFDSSGIGPSDHTSFYNAGIPVLFFFTGTHKDYHKPSDKADLINYPGEVEVINYVDRVIARLDEDNQKPKYTVTKQKISGNFSYKVTLGIMPDYTFQDGGVRVDGVSDNRPAFKAGIKQGDIIIKLGDITITGMQTYMEALGKFTPGDKTQVTITRAGKDMVLPIVLTGK